MRACPRQMLSRTFAVMLGCVLLCGTVVPAYASPSNAAIREKRKQAQEADAKLQDLGDALEMRGEELAKIERALLDTRDQIRATESDLDEATADLTRSQALLDRRVSSIYRNGPVTAVSMLVGAADFNDLISRIDLMRRIGESDAAMVASVKAAKARVEASQRALEGKQAEQIALRDQARTKRDEVQSALADQQRYAASIQKDLKALIVKERKRLEAIAAKKRAQAEAAARAAAARNNRPFTGNLGPAHPQVVEIAARYIGVPYVWGGTSPSGFDCSGLVQYCYREIGILLPRTSSVQYGAGSYIPANRLDLLQPGDLVFFGYGGDADRIHHVGIYAGGGMMIEAPYTGASVRRSSLIARIASRGDYVGACRP